MTKGDGRFDWIVPKLTVSQKDIVKDVNTTRLLRFPEKTTRNTGNDKNVWCCMAMILSNAIR